jgi:hypothetical protein
VNALGQLQMWGWPARGVVISQCREELCNRKDMGCRYRGWENDLLLPYRNALPSPPMRIQAVVSDFTPSPQSEVIHAPVCYPLEDNIRYGCNRKIINYNLDPRKSNTSRTNKRFCWSRVLSEKLAVSQFHYCYLTLSCVC